tara:strand:+ start:113 stop:1150 length:1038 start_codon:yes stop_codon:yes gene_type:complete
MQKTAGEIAEILHGRIEGDETVVLNGLAKIEEAGPGDLTFLANPAYELHLYKTRASAAIVADDFKPVDLLPEGLNLLRVENPYTAFTQLMQWAAKKAPIEYGIHPTAVISKEAQVSDQCHIGPLVIIEAGVIVRDNCEIHGNAILSANSKIGESTTIHGGVFIGKGTEIGSFCIIQAGAIIGADGFGFAPQSNASFAKIPQLGNVVIEDHCEIGAATTVDRATLGSTRIGKGVKLDNQIQVAHNVSIGQNTVIAAQTGIAGSTSIGANCMIGGQVGFAGHISVADGVKIAAQSGVTKSIKESNSTWQGTPASPIRDYQQQQIQLRKLVRNKALERIDQMEKKLNG